jgi:putative intracellular protease/amidase
MNPAKILIIATSNGQMGETTRKTGLWLEELAAPYYIFKDAGVTTTLASPKGGVVPLDPKSESIVAATGPTKRFQKDPEAMTCLLNSIPLKELRADNFDVVLLLGGHGPMWDFASDDTLKQLLEDFIRQNKFIGALCHGVAGLLSLQDSTGAPFLKGKKLTGFSNSEEELSGMSSLMPFLLESKLMSLGALYSKAPNYTGFTVTDGHLITGQNPSSSVEIAKKLLLLLKQTSITPLVFALN